MLVGANPGLLIRLGLGVVVADGACVGVLCDAGAQSAPAGDSDLVLALDLLVEPGLVGAGREAALELALLKVCHGILAEGNELGEEVVEVVRDERVVDTAGVAETGEDGEPQQEAAEPVLLGLGLDWVGGDARGAGAGGRCGRGLDDGGRARGSLGRVVHDGRVGRRRGSGHLGRRDGRLLDARRARRVDGGLDDGRRVGDGGLVQLFVVGVPALGNAPLRAGGACQWPGSRTGRKDRGAQHAGRPPDGGDGGDGGGGAVGSW